MAETKMQPISEPVQDIFEGLEAPAPVKQMNIEEKVKQMDDTLTTNVNKKITEGEFKPAGVIKLKTDILPQLDSQVEAFLAKIVSSEVQSDEMSKISSTVRNLGANEIQKSQAISQRFLDKPLKTLKDTDSAFVGKNLIELRKVVEKLDPSKKGKFFSKQNLLRFIPFGEKADNALQEYQSADTQIRVILESLYNGKDNLLQDNAQIQVSRKSMYETMGKLEQIIYITKKLDKSLTEVLPAIEAEDEFKARVIKEDVLFYTRQRTQDLLAHMAVCVQGYMALGVIEKNNEELIKGVERASQTTVHALQVAVMISQALATQKQVLGQVNAVNKTTENLLAQNSSMLREQGVEIQRQATSAAIDPEVIKKSFQDVFAAMDDIEKFKLASLDSMEKTIESYQGAINDAQKYIDKNRKAKLTNLTGDIKNAIARENDTVVTLDRDASRPKM
jgi:uncharacterized protein YaaN involved in tellurite resistance